MVFAEISGDHRRRRRYEPKAIALIADELLDARTSSKTLGPRCGNDALMRARLRALRFNPMAPLLLRRCERDCTWPKVQIGHERSTRNAGRRRDALAMFDEDEIPDPRHSDRSPDDAYLHFGFGQHQCFGIQINRFRCRSARPIAPVGRDSPRGRRRTMDSRDLSPIAWSWMVRARGTTVVSTM